MTTLLGLSSGGLVRMLRATSLVACLGLSLAWERYPLGGWIGGDTAAVLLGMKLGNPLSLNPWWTMLICGSHHLISQAGCKRCNVILLYS